jgi:hypothetical protein
MPMLHHTHSYPTPADYMCRYGVSGRIYGSSETVLPTHATCGFAATVADTSKPDAQAFSLVSKASTTSIVSATPASVFAPLGKSSGGTYNIYDHALVTALSPHPTKVMLYYTAKDGFLTPKEQYDIQAVAMIDFAQATPVASLHLDLVANALTNRWIKLLSGPDGESVYLSGVIRDTTTPVYGRYKPGTALEVQAGIFDDQPTSMIGLFG